MPPHAWLRPDDRVVILAHGRWGPSSGAKTGEQVLRYAAARTVAVVDPRHAGKEAAQVANVQNKGPVPIHASLAEAIEAVGVPTRVLVGIAPPGGRLPDDMRTDIRQALARGIAVIAGLHAFLADDPEFSEIAAKNGTPIVDLRRPRNEERITNGAARHIPVPVILTVGTDCSSGKMTVAVALREAAKERGIRAAFVATGQTGLLLAPDAGLPADRIVVDFAAGEVEREVMSAARLDADGRPTEDTPDLIIVEGQGAISHPSYAPVSLALLHGAWPDALIMCHVVDRPEKTVPTDGPPFPLLAVPEEMRLNEMLLQQTTGARTAAVCTLYLGTDDARYQGERARIEEETDLPVHDVLRDGAAPLLDTILEHLSASVPGKRLPTPRPVA